MKTDPSYSQKPNKLNIILRALGNSLVPILFDSSPQKDFLEIFA